MLALAVAFLVFLVALGSNRSVAHARGPGELSSTNDFLFELLVVTTAIVVIPACIYALWEYIQIFRDNGPAAVRRRRPEWQQAAILLAILIPVGLALMLLARLFHDTRILPKSHGRPRIPGKRGAPVPDTSSAPQLQHPWLLVVTVIVFAVVVAGFLILRYRKARLTERSQLDLDDQLRRSDLREAISVSIAELESEPDSRRAVIRAYVGMEAALARHGVGRRPSEAPLEYLARSLAAIRVSRRSCEDLTRLFQRARFSHHTVDAEMKRDAIAALRRVQGELGEAAR